MAAFLFLEEIETADEHRSAQMRKAENQNINAENTEKHRGHRETQKDGETVMGSGQGKLKARGR